MFAVMALRILVAAVFGLVTLLSPSSNLFVVLLAVVGVFSIDARNLLSLKNFAVVYILLVFGVGGSVLHMGRPFIFGDIVAYLIAFLAAYALASLRSTRRGADAEGLPEDEAVRRQGMLSVKALTKSLLLLIALNLMFLGLQLLKYGVIGYYQGQSLLIQAQTYGTASTVGGAEQILRFGLKYSGIALVILYVRASFELGLKIRYKYPVGILVALPILSLNRFDAVVGALTALAIFACDARTSARRREVADPSEQHRSAGAAAGGPTITRGIVIAAALVLAVSTALFIADLRSRFGQNSAQRPALTTLASLSSELSPVEAYGDIKANIGVLGYQRGRTIVLPAIFKVVPRAWYPDKPPNSGAYYMETLRPAEFRAGFALPPTVFGDAYLSFGFGGAVAMSMALGALAARLDMGYKRANLRRLPWFLLVFANFYGILRYPISESLAGFLLTLLVWLLADRLFRTKSEMEGRGPRLDGAN
jgi:hypothetical protein